MSPRTLMLQPRREPLSRACLMILKWGGPAFSRSCFSAIPPVKSSKPSIVLPPDNASQQPLSLQRDTDLSGRLTHFTKGDTRRGLWVLAGLPATRCVTLPYLERVFYTQCRLSILSVGLQYLAQAYYTKKRPSPLPYFHFQQRLSILLHIGFC